MRHFGGLLGTSSDLKLVPEDAEHQCSSQVSVEPYGGQVVSGVLGHVYLTVGSVDPGTHPVLWFV